MILGRSGNMLSILRNIRSIHGCSCTPKPAMFAQTQSGMQRLTRIKCRQSSSLVERLRYIPSHNYVLLVIPCITLYLGVWQVRRRKWKLSLIEELERKIMLPGVVIPPDLSEVSSEREYETFILRGEFDHSREAHIGPRHLLGDDSAGGLLSNSNTIGVHVVTPLKLKDRTEEVLINRGWVSMKQKKDNNIHRPEGEQRVVGVYRNKEKGSDNSQFYDKRTAMWSRRNVPVLAQTLGTEELFFDMAESRHNFIDTNSPVPGQTRVQLRNEHLSYLITWFSLTIIISIIWWRRYVRKTDRDNLKDMLEVGRKHKQREQQLKNK